MWERGVRIYGTARVSNNFPILCTYYHSFLFLFFVNRGNCTKTTKFPDRVQPPLARWSVHIFTSWNTWLILIQWNWRRRYLQSLSNEEYELLEGFVDRTKSTITFASNSTMSWVIPSWEANIKPSLKAQNYAMILVATPMCLI